MTGIPCFLMEQTDREWRWLRRYRRDEEAREGHSYCQAAVSLGEFPRTVADGLRGSEVQDGPQVPDDDPRWPTRCETCECPFEDSDPRQVFRATGWRVVRTQPGAPEVGETFSLMYLGPQAPPGAMWYADWWSADRNKGPDGRTLMCRTPGGDWMVDGVANNCTLPDDVDHRCWLRVGEPPHVTAGKDFGDGRRTCSAGAGSIGQPNWHGFLRDGHLVLA